MSKCVLCRPTLEFLGVDPLKIKSHEVVNEGDRPPHWGLFEDEPKKPAAPKSKRKTTASSPAPDLFGRADSEDIDDLFQAAAETTPECRTETTPEHRTETEEDFLFTGTASSEADTAKLVESANNFNRSRVIEYTNMKVRVWYTESSSMVGSGCVDFTTQEIPPCHLVGPQRVLVLTWLEEKSECLVIFGAPPSKGCNQFTYRLLERSAQNVILMTTHHTAIGKLGRELYLALGVGAVRQVTMLVRAQSYAPTRGHQG
ncbi:hypothetical protein LSAT2_029180 [Lamellibrachia satsuma]|nr:hypothetical protein LSAT2_029180 [Lamellibrachia satsuma]